MKTKTKYILIGVGIAFGLFLMLLLIPNNVRFNFYVEETGESVSGEVYLNEEYLGEAIGGSLDVAYDLLYPGELTFNGDYNEAPFSFKFDFDRDYEDYNSLDFTISSDELSLVSLASGSEQTKEIEEEILKLLNEERAKEGVAPIKRNEAVDLVARNHAKDMAENKYFTNTNLQGDDLVDRLRKKSIFIYAASENILFSELVSGKNIAEGFVAKWMSGVGTKNPIIDKNVPLRYTNVGIGVYCTNSEVTFPTCYAVTDFVAIELHISKEIKKNRYGFYTVYPEDYGFDFDVEVSINFEASEKTHFILVESQKDYDNFLSRDKYNNIFKENTKSFFEESVTLKPGYGLIIGSEADDTSFNVSIVPKSVA